MIVHVPAPTRLTPPPDNEHTDVSPDVNVTARPDDDVGATGIGASPYVAPLGAGFVNVIVCAAFATVTDAGTVVDAPSYVPSDATLAEIEHEPAPVIVTTPVDAFTEHAEPDAEYVTVPEPTDGDADTENDASPYVFEYDVTENDNVLDAEVISAVIPVGCDTE